VVEKRETQVDIYFLGGVSMTFSRASSGGGLGRDAPTWRRAEQGRSQNQNIEAPRRTVIGEVCDPSHVSPRELLGTVGTLLNWRNVEEKGGTSERI